MVNGILDFIFWTANAQSAPTMRRIDPRPGGPTGPTITFNNDVTGGPSTDLPVMDELARLIEDVVVSTGLDVNINSTTGGHASGPHTQGRAADINYVGGSHVTDPANAANVHAFQQALINHPLSNQILG